MSREYHKGNPRFTWDDVKSWMELHEQGMMYSEIAKEIGVNDGYIRGKVSFYKNHILPVLQKSEEPVKEEPKKQEKQKPVEVKKATLADFTPREIIQYMYSLGYRIDSEGLYQIEVRKNRVKLTDIIQ